MVFMALDDQVAKLLAENVEVVRERDELRRKFDEARLQIVRLEDVALCAEALCEAPREHLRHVDGDGGPRCICDWCVLLRRTEERRRVAEGKLDS